LYLLCLPRFILVGRTTGADRAEGSFFWRIFSPHGYACGGAATCSCHCGLWFLLCCRRSSALPAALFCCLYHCIIPLQYVACITNERADIFTLLATTRAARRACQPAFYLRYLPAAFLQAGGQASGAASGTAGRRAGRFNSGCGNGCACPGGDVGRACSRGDWANAAQGIFCALLDFGRRTLPTGSASSPSCLCYHTCLFLSRLFPVLSSHPT